MNWKSIILVPVKEILTRLASFMPTLTGILIILVIGWLAAKLIQKLITGALKTVKLDTIAEKTRISSFLETGGITYTLSELIGVLSYWLVMLIVVMAAINALGLIVAADLLNKVIGYIPNVIAAVFILVLGIFFAALLATVVHTAASNAGIGQAKLLSQVAQVIIIIFAVIIALEQLGVAVDIVKFALEAVIAAAALGLGIAFGLGCKDMAGKSMQNFLDKLKRG